MWLWHLVWRPGIPGVDLRWRFLGPHPGEVKELGSWAHLWSVCIWNVGCDGRAPAAL